MKTITRNDVTYEVEIDGSDIWLYASNGKDRIIVNGAESLRDKLVSETGGYDQEGYAKIGDDLIEDMANDYADDYVSEHFNQTELVP